MARLSNHSKERSVERVEGVETFSDAKKCAKQAKQTGATIDKFIRYPNFYSYLQNKRYQTATTRIRIFKDNIYIWRGNNQTLVTVHPIPDRYKDEMEVIDNDGLPRSNDETDGACRRG